ncbi:MAG: pyruvate kinase [Spongiibacteraceae bacterium]
MRKTKVICTIGPATESLEMLERLYAAGMNVARLNMSHGDHPSHLRVIDALRQLNAKLQTPVAILLDTQGPEIRTGDLNQDLYLKEGEVISVSVRSGDNVEETSLQINYEDLLEAVNIGDRITVDNGLINLEVLQKFERSLSCRVVDGGTVKSKRHVNLPGIRVNLPAITKKDERDIAFGVEQGVDFIALSFVREANDVKQLREFLSAHNGEHIKIIAKIEDQEGVRNLESIVAVADGVMVARGDLGVEIPVETLPSVQRKIVRLCAENGRRVIVATHLLESMIVNPIPTRAEVTDVANAVYEEVDAIMLSGETTVGKHPIKCVEYLDRISRQTEQFRGLRFSEGLAVDVPKQHLATAAVKLAEALGVRGMVVITRRGVMANYVANCRPRVPVIYAFTNDESVLRQMALNYATQAHLIPFHEDSEQTLADAFAALRNSEGFAAGDQVVVLSDVLAAPGVEAILVRQIS